MNHQQSDGRLSLPSLLEMGFPSLSVTSFLEMPSTKPLTTTQATLDHKLQWAAKKSLVNYGFFIGATAANLPDLNTVTPTCGVKIFMSSCRLR